MATNNIYPEDVTFTIIIVTTDNYRESKDTRDLVYFIIILSIDCFKRREIVFPGH